MDRGIHSTCFVRKNVQMQADDSIAGVAQASRLRVSAPPEALAKVDLGADVLTLNAAKFRRDTPLTFAAGTTGLHFTPQPCLWSYQI